MTWKSYLPRLSHTLLQEWQPCSLLAEKNKIFQTYGIELTEQKWYDCPNCDCWSLFVQSTISSRYLFKTGILGANRDWEINTSVRQYSKAAATLFARKPQRFLPQQLPEMTARRRPNSIFMYFLQPNEDKWKIKSSSALPSKALAEMMSEPESKQIHQSTYDGEMWYAHMNNKWQSILQVYDNYIQIKTYWIDRCKKYIKTVSASPAAWQSRAWMLAATRLLGEAITAAEALRHFQRTVGLIWFDTSSLPSVMETPLPWNSGTENKAIPYCITVSTWYIYIYIYLSISMGIDMCICTHTYILCNTSRMQ